MFVLCEFSQDRKGGGVKEVRRAGEGQEGRNWNGPGGRIERNPPGTEKE